MGCGARAFAGLAAAGACCLTLAASGGNAEDRQANIWYKLCTDKPLTSMHVPVRPGDMCQTMADVRDNKSAVLVGRLSLGQIPGRSRYRLQAMLPLGSALVPGALIKINNGEPIKLAYRECDDKGCYAETAVESSVAGRMRTGKQVAYLGVDVSGRALSIPLPLAGFAQVFDGAAKPVSKYLDDERKIDAVIAGRAGPPSSPRSPAIGFRFASVTRNTTIPTPWYKLCVAVPEDRKDPNGTTVNVCLTQVDVRDKATAMLAGKFAVRRVQGRKALQMLAMVPLGVFLPEGASVTLDNEDPIALKFTTCDRTGCYAEANIDSDVVDRLRNGSRIAYAAKDENGLEVSISLGLADFAGAFDGPALPPAQYNAYQRELAEILRAEAASRQRPAPPLPVY